MNNRYIPFIAIHIILALTIASCAEKDDYEHIIGAPFNFTKDSLTSYNGFNYANPNEVPKILVFLKMDCPSCIEEIYKISLSLKEEPYDNANLYVILSGQPSEYTYYHLVKINKFNFEILYDPFDVLITSNSMGFLTFKKYLLLSPENITVAIGSPFESPRTRRIYSRNLKN